MTVELDKTKVSRDQLVADLRKRDGDMCQFPGETHLLDFSVVDGPAEATIDHWIPQHFGRENGWTWEQIWHIDNLRLMCKKHNAKKADRIPNEDGTLPERATRTFRYRRQKRAGRPDLCVECDNGNDLAADEVCANCGCTAKRFPRWAKVPYNECTHDIFWCWVCSITPDMRAGATEMILIGGEGGE